MYHSNKIYITYDIVYKACFLNLTDTYVINFDNSYLLDVLIQTPIDDLHSTIALNKYWFVYAFPEVVQYLLNNGGKLRYTSLNKYMKFVKSRIRTWEKPDSAIGEAYAVLKSKLKDLRDDSL